jgi:hypothetical protein
MLVTMVRRAAEIAGADGRSAAMAAAAGFFGSASALCTPRPATGAARGASRDGEARGGDCRRRRLVSRDGGGGHFLWLGQCTVYAEACDQISTRCWLRR